MWDLDSRRELNTVHRVKVQSFALLKPERKVINLILMLGKKAH